MSAATAATKSFQYIDMGEKRLGPNGRLAVSSKREAGISTLDKTQPTSQQQPPADRVWCKFAIRR